MKYNLIKNKRGIAPLLFLILLAGVVVLAMNWDKIDLASLTGSGNYIERPIFYYDKCEALSSLKYSDPTQLANDGQWLNRPSVTNSYNVKIKTPSSKIGYTKPRIEYYVCNSQALIESNCRSYSIKTLTSYNTEFTISDVKPTEYVWVQYAEALASISYKGRGGATYQIGFIPYGIREYNVLSGSPNPLNPNDCTLPSGYTSGKAEILSDDLSKTNVVSPKTNENTFQPEEVRWYVAGYLTSAAPSFMLQYSGQNAWCRTTGTSGEIYKINTVTTDGGTYKIASPDWSDSLGTVTCCPGSTRGSDVCQADFTWKSIQASECGAFKSCGSPNPVPYSEKKTIQYSCVDGKCQQNIVDRECASDYDCKDANKLCNLNTWKCVDANVDLKGQVIKTIPDNIAACQAEGGTWKKTTDSTKEGVFCFFGQGLCQTKTIVNEYCDVNKGFDWLSWLYLIIIIVVIIIAFRFLYPTLRGLLHF